MPPRCTNNGSRPTINNTQRPCSSRCANPCRPTLHVPRSRPGAAAAAQQLVLTEDAVADYIQGQPQLASLTRGTRATQVVPLPDGVINTVYGVHGPGWSLLLKQAMPYVRVVGPSFPLSQVRHAAAGCAVAASKTDTWSALSSLHLEHWPHQQQPNKPFVQRLLSQKHESMCAGDAYPQSYLVRVLFLHRSAWLWKPQPSPGCSSCTPPMPRSCCCMISSTACWPCPGCRPHTSSWWRSFKMDR
jgi:hypothetical protein